MSLYLYPSASQSESTSYRTGNGDIKQPQPPTLRDETSQSTQSTFRARKEPLDRERVLSDHLCARSQEFHHSDSETVSLQLSWSPIALEDTRGSPLRESMEAYVDAGVFLRPPRSLTSSSAAGSVNDARREKEKDSGVHSQGICGSLDSAVTPTLCLSLQSRAESELGTLVDVDFYDPGPKAGYTYAPDSPLDDYDSDETSSSGIPHTITEDINEWERDLIAHSPPNQLQLQAAEFRSNTDVARTQSQDRSQWLVRRRTALRDEDAERPSLVPSFHSEGSSPSTPVSKSSGNERRLVGKVASAVRLGYVAVSYKVKLAVFRAEKKVGRKFSGGRSRSLS
ncbi:hypothetical protein BDN70DRAFT_432951 [Pholiota conissans]|uniref:Uncharacterized protein n=1 Tax=Pholiota conissans TaxID=109636 RepID=A0A9P6CTC0_9AGAR|nr:hypothetical protein BDN70DRAFT_432951 [Pholiota conissans]